jgi:type II secretion system protein N
MAVRESVKEWGAKLGQKILSLRERKSRWWVIIGYLLLGISLFSLFTYWCFPYPQLKEKLIRRLEAETNLRLEVRDFQPSFFTGLILRKVDIFSGQISKSSAFLSLPLLRLRISIFPLIWGSLSLKVYSDLYDGHLAGRFKKRGSRMSVDCKWKDLEIEKYVLLRETYGLKVKGKFSGEMDLSIDPENFLDNKGATSFLIEGAELSESSLFGLFKLPGISFDNCQGRLVLGSERLVVEQGSIMGPDLEVEIEGALELQQKLSQSNIDLGVRLKLAQSLSEELNDILPLLRIKADSEGFYNFSIKGKLAQPRLGR